MPGSTTTFLFTDIEGSTRLETRVGTERYAALRERHRALIRAALAAHAGAEQGTEGDSFFVTFASARDGVAAAVDAQRALAAEAWPPDGAIRVRMGVHSGEASTLGGSLVGLDINRTARIAALAHGGQVAVSAATRALVGETLPSEVAWRDLGEHQLRDLDATERIWQLDIAGLEQDFPPLRSSGRRRGNLPTRLTSFVGRDQELREVLELASTSRLLTLTGPGGTGKTRLALEVGARSAARYPDGVYFVPLEPIAESTLVPATIAQRLELPDRGGLAPMERVREHLRDRSLLLILDNFEQVIDAAPLVTELLGDAPGLGVVVTSREALRVYGEHEYAVPPLALPESAASADLAQASRFGAVALFVERARAVLPAFELTEDNVSAVVGICQRLDGLPLAIELAAARVKLLSPGAMLARLANRLALPGSGSRDLPARQQTLRGAIAWSHDLLDRQDQDLFACCSVFGSAVDLEAVEAVCASADRDVLDGLASLVDKSLVRRLETTDGGSRYRMLETIREYAAEQLEAAGRTAELRQRHVQEYRRRAEAVGALGPRADRAVLDHVEADHVELRSAIMWAMDTGDAEDALAIGAGLWRFWQMRGYITEGSQRLEMALAMPGCDDAEVRMRALEAAGGLAYWSNDQPRARRWYALALELRRAQGDPRMIAEALYNLSFTYTFDEDQAIGEALVREAVELYQSVGDAGGLALVRWALANIEFAKGPGHFAAAHDLARLSLEGFTAVGDRFMTGWATYTVGLAAITSGDLVEARERLLAALGLFMESGDVSGYTLVLDASASIELRLGARQRAARIAGAVDHLERTTGTGINRTNRANLGYDPDLLRDSADTASAFQEGARMDIQDALAYVLEGDAAS